MLGLCSFQVWEIHRKLIIIWLSRGLERACGSLACFHLQREQLFASSSGRAPRQAADERPLPVLSPCPQTHERQEEGSLVWGLGHGWIRGPRISIQHLLGLTQCFRENSSALTCFKYSVWKDFP